MNAEVVERVAGVLQRARVAGGWVDDVVARQVLAVLQPDDLSSEDGRLVGGARGLDQPDAPDAA